MSLKSVNWEDAETKSRATSYGIVGAETVSAFLSGATLFVMNTLIIESIFDWAIDMIREDLKKRVHNYIWINYNSLYQSSLFRNIMYGPA